MEKPHAKAVSIIPKAVFGLRTDVVGNIHFDGDKTVIYPVSGVLAFMDVETKKQKFLRLVENSQPTIIGVSPNRKLIAVAEKMPDKTVTNIYEIATLKRKKVLTLTGCTVNEPAAIAFTHDSRNVAILSKEPDAFLSVFALDKEEGVFMGRASNSAMPGRARFISCNPGDTAITAIAGEFLLKLMNKTEKGFGQIGTVKGDNLTVTSIAWLSQDILMAGTNESEILFVEGGDPKAKYPANDTNLIDLTKIPEGEEMIAPSQDDVQEKENIYVKCITNFNKGFIFALHNVVHVYEKESSFKFIKRTILTIPITLYDHKSYRIINMAVNLQEDTVIATTEHSQIYIAQLFKTESLKVISMEFKTLGEPLHIDSIIALSVCAWKSIIMTASKDYTVRIWNYKTLKIELVKKYQLKISVLKLHPSGIFVAIGFSDSLRFLQIQLDTLKATKRFLYPNCNVVEFSNRGHLMAVAHERMVHIICIFTFELLHTLRGHNGDIGSLVWSSNDSKLVSSGCEGAIYEWDSLTGKRINEIVQKGAEYRCLALSSDGSSIFAITSGGVLREIVKSDVIREFHTPDSGNCVNCVAMARTDMFIFVGTEGGYLYSVQCPLGETGGGAFTNFRFYHSAVTKVKITYDDKLLVTAGKDGTLVIWTLLNIDGKTSDIDADLGTCTDIMTNRDEILTKIDTIKALKLRMNQQVEEYQYKIAHGDSFHSEQMRDIHQHYCDLIEEFKTKMNTMQSEFTEQIVKLELHNQKLENDHQKETIKMETDFSEKIINEYEKVANLKSRMDEMKEDYELKLRKSAGSLQDTIEAMKKSWKEQLQERSDLVSQLLRNIEEQKKEFVEYCKQIEIDNDRNMVETQLNYEKKLKDESEACIYWRGQAGVLEKKISTVSERSIEMHKQIEVLTQQQAKSKQTIEEMQVKIDTQNEDIDDLDIQIKNQEKQFLEVNRKNVELDKHRQVLTDKMYELKGQFEPLEVELREKKDHIVQVEKDLGSIQKNYNELVLQMADLKEKYAGNATELKRERQSRRKAYEQFAHVCGEIHEVVELIQRPEKLKAAIIELYRKYASNKEVQQMLHAETQIQNEFMRQRDHIEKLCAGSKVTEETKKGTSEMDRLMKENVFLISELNKMRENMTNLKKEHGQMQTLLGLSTKYMPTKLAREKLDKASQSAEMIEKKFRGQIESLEQKIKILQDEVQTLKEN